MEWMVVSKGNDKRRTAKFGWRPNRYESLKNAWRDASHEWTKRLNKLWLPVACWRWLAGWLIWEDLEP